MTADSPLKIQPLEKYRATMTKEEVAEALGVARHIIPPLSQAGLIKPLGRPQRYCVKHYSRDVLAQQLADVGWLDKVVAAITGTGVSKTRTSGQNRPETVRHNPMAVQRRPRRLDNRDKFGLAHILKLVEGI